MPELQAIVAIGQDNVTGLYATLKATDSTFQHSTGGVVLGHPRLKSPPFSFVLPRTDNLYQSFGINVSGTVAPAAADGFFSFIPDSLVAGYYKLEFGGIQLNSNGQGNTFTEAITYLITVLP